MIGFGSRSLPNSTDISGSAAWSRRVRFIGRRNPFPWGPGYPEESLLNPGSDPALFRTDLGESQLVSHERGNSRPAGGSLRSGPVLSKEVRTGGHQSALEI